MRVYANTDIEESTAKRHARCSAADETTPPISGWMEAKGVVVETTPNGDQILMGEAANQESLASDPRGPANAAQSARLLYRRLVEMFPNSPLVPEAAWRAADIHGKFRKPTPATRPSAKERDPYMRDQMDEDELKKVIKHYPHTRQADLAAFDLIDNKLCGDWQGSHAMPGEGIRDLREICRRISRRPAHRAGSLPGRLPPGRAHRHVRRRRQRRKSSDAHNQAARPGRAAQRQVSPTPITACRAGALVFKLDEGVPVYGIDRE